MLEEPYVVTRTDTTTTKEHRKHKKTALIQKEEQGLHLQ